MGADETAFRFNFTFGEDDGGPSVGNGDPPIKDARSPKRPRPATGTETAQELRIPEPRGSHPTTSDRHDRFALQDVGGSVRLWKVVELMQQSTLVQGLDEETDLVPGRYEGGVKVWECSVDLCEHLVEAYGLKPARDGACDGACLKGRLEGSRVLELGCGQGLPGVLCLLGGAEQVVFQDFNGEVLRYVTQPCVQRNLGGRDPDGTTGSVRYISGDWDGCGDLLERESFDLILTAETIYEPKSVPSLLDLLAWCLKPGTGVALVAAKVYYFGVGGGVAPFEEEVRRQGLFHIEHVRSVDDGASNMREVLLLRRKPEG